MSTFWSGYIALLTLGTIVALFWLIFATRKGESAGTTDQTMGHASTASRNTINRCRAGGSCCSSARWYSAFSTGALPGPGQLEGVLPGYEGGWTQEKQWEREVSQADEVRPDLRQVRAMSVEQVAQDPQAVKMGARLFANSAPSAMAPTPRAPWASRTWPTSTGAGAVMRPRSRPAF